MLKEILETGLLLGWFVLLLIVVAWVLLGVSARRRDRPLVDWASRHRAWIVLFVLVLGLAFGTFDEYRSQSLTPKSVVENQFFVGRFFDALYEGVLQILINGSIESGDSVYKRMARLAGLAAILLLANEAIQQLFAKPIQQFWLSRQNRHVVICGLGRIGRSIISDLTAAFSHPRQMQSTQVKSSERGKPQVGFSRYRSGPKLVVIERNKDNPDIAWAESRGVIVLVGDATDESVLMQIRAERANDVIIALGSDELNLEAAYDVMSLINRPTSRKIVTNPRIFVHLLNPRLESMLVQAKQRVMTREGVHDRRLTQNSVVQPFNVVDRSIQGLLDGIVLDRRPTQRGEVAHFVIVGFGEVGQELAVKLAQLAHYENLSRPRMTIVYSPSDEGAVQHFQELYPKFFPKLDSFASELSAIGLDHKDYNVWMPFENLDDWSFGVSISSAEVSSGAEAFHSKSGVEESRGVEFAVNGGFALSSGGVTCDKFIRNLETLSHSKGVRTMVFICHADDDLNCADATELRQELDLRLKQMAMEERSEELDIDDRRVTILPYVPNRPMLHRLIEPEKKPGADLVPWGDFRQSCAYNVLVADMFRPLATAINHDYDLKLAQQQASRDHVEFPARQSIPLKSLDSMLAWERHSNLMAAYHVNAKLAPLGLVVRPWAHGFRYKEPDRQRIDSIISRSVHHQVHRSWLAETQDDRLLETVAKMEHNRWLAERLLMDWGYGPKASQERPENKRRLAFVDWENLLDSEEVKDRDQIARILELCREESNRPESERRFVLTVKED